jgi:hypothetical protein
MSTAYARSPSGTIPYKRCNALRGVGPGDDVGAQLDLAEGDLAHVDLDEPAGVGEQHLHVPRLTPRPPPARFPRAGAEPLTAVVEDPGPGAVLEERPPVVREDELLLVPLLRDRRVADDPEPTPGPDQEGQRLQPLVQLRPGHD